MIIGVFLLCGMRNMVSVVTVHDNDLMLGSPTLVVVVAMILKLVVTSPL